MQPVGLCDTVRLAPAALGAARDEVLCPDVDGDNLALTALRDFRARSGWTGAPVRLEIDKRIPVAAGMAGGSADAGAALRLAARAAGLRDDALLHEVAAGLGADVPAQVRPRRYLATGAGEELLRAPRPAAVRRARGALCPAALHRRRLSRGRPPRPAAQRRRARGAARRARRVARSRIGDARRGDAGQRPRPGGGLAAARAGVDARRRAPRGRTAALVCGSGPTVIGLFADLERARSAAVSLGDRRPRPLAVEPWYQAITMPEGL